MADPFEGKSRIEQYKMRKLLAVEEASPLFLTNDEDALVELVRSGKLDGHLNTFRVTKYGGTMLHCAVESGFSKLVRELLERGSDINRAFVDAKEVHEDLLPIESAVEHPSVLAVLLAFGVDPNTLSRGLPPLMYAVDNAESTRLLLEAGADPLDPRGYTTPIAKARHNGYKESYALLAAAAKKKLAGEPAKPCRPKGRGKKALSPVTTRGISSWIQAFKNDDGDRGWAFLLVRGDLADSAPAIASALGGYDVRSGMTTQVFEDDVPYFGVQLEGMPWSVVLLDEFRSSRRSGVELCEKLGGAVGECIGFDAWGAVHMRQGKVLAKVSPGRWEPEEGYPDAETLSSDEEWDSAVDAVLEERTGLAEAWLVERDVWIPALHATGDGLQAWLELPSLKKKDIKDFVAFVKRGE